jgi:hypothetical protein
MGGGPHFSATSGTRRSRPLQASGAFYDERSARRRVLRGEPNEAKINTVKAVYFVVTWLGRITRGRDMAANVAHYIEIGFVGIGIWVTLALLVPALCTYSVWLRSNRSKDLNDGVFENSDLQNSAYYRQYIEINTIRHSRLKTEPNIGIQATSMWRKTRLPILLIFCFCIYFASLLVYTWFLSYK